MTHETPADKTIAALERLLTDLGLEPERDETVAGFHIEFGAGVPVTTAFAAIAPDSQRFVFYINLGVNVEPAQRDEMSRLITRVNWRLMVGSYDMDFDDGHVRFRMAIDFHDGELTENLMRNAILTAMNAIEAYAAALLSVAIGAQSAEQAIRAIEAAQSGHGRR